MLTPKNNASQMRTQILVKIVEKFLQNRFADADRIPLEINPKSESSNRCCTYKERAAWQQWDLLWMMKTMN